MSQIGILLDFTAWLSIVSPVMEPVFLQMAIMMITTFFSFKVYRQLIICI